MVYIIINNASENEKKKKLLVSENRMKVNDNTLFFLREFSSLDIRPEIISPSESTTLCLYDQQASHPPLESMAPSSSCCHRNMEI